MLTSVLQKHPSHQKISHSEQIIEEVLIHRNSRWFFSKIFIAQQLPIRLSRPNKFWKAKDELFLISNTVCVIF